MDGFASRGRQPHPFDLLFSRCQLGDDRVGGPAALSERASL
jgi:hypothetical protein